MNTDKLQQSISSKTLSLILAVSITLAAFLMPTTTALAEDWEDWKGYVGTNPQFYELTTEIDITEYNLHFTNNKNAGALLFCWKIEPWDGSIPSFLSNVGFTTSCNYKMTCIVLFKVAEGFRLEGNDLSPNSQNLTSWVSISGMHMLFDTENVKVVPQTRYENSHAFDFPNDIPVSDTKTWKTYATNSKKLAIVSYATKWANFSQAGGVNYAVLGQVSEVYFQDNSAAASLTNVSDDMITRMEYIVENQPTWISTGYPLLCMKMSVTDVGESAGAVSTAQIIENYLSYVNVTFDGNKITAEQLKHLSNVQTYQEFLQNGSYEDWIAAQKLKEQINDIKIPTINGINDLFVAIDPNESGFNIILNSIFGGNNVIALLILTSLGFGVLSLVIYGTKK